MCRPNGNSDQHPISVYAEAGFSSLTDTKAAQKSKSVNCASIDSASVKISAYRLSAIPAVTWTSGIRGTNGPTGSLTSLRSVVSVFGMNGFLCAIK